MQGSFHARHRGVPHHHHQQLRLPALGAVVRDPAHADARGCPEDGAERPRPFRDRSRAPRAATTARTRDSASTSTSRGPPASATTRRSTSRPGRATEPPARSPTPRDTARSRGANKRWWAPPPRDRGKLSAASGGKPTPTRQNPGHRRRRTRGDAPDATSDHPDAAAAAERLNDAGVRAFGEKRYAVAYKAYSECLRLRPDTVPYLGNRAAAGLKMRGKERDVVKDCERAVELDPGYARMSREWDEALALGARRQGRRLALRGAKRALERALEISSREIKPPRRRSRKWG